LDSPETLLVSSQLISSRSPCPVSLPLRCAGAGGARPDGRMRPMPPISGAAGRGWVTIQWRVHARSARSGAVRPRGRRRRLAAGWAPAGSPCRHCRRCRKGGMRVRNGSWSSLFRPSLLMSPTIRQWWSWNVMVHYGTER